jgi:hypothetical protein
VVFWALLRKYFVIYSPSQKKYFSKCSHPNDERRERNPSTCTYGRGLSG